MCRFACLALISMLFLFGGSLAAATESPSEPIAGADSRFRIQGEIRPQTLSSDGRYSLGAAVRYTPEGRSADGRFGMKALNGASCDPFADALFANGFEAN